MRKRHSAPDVLVMPHERVAVDQAGAHLSIRVNRLGEDPVDMQRRLEACQLIARSLPTAVLTAPAVVHPRPTPSRRRPMEDIPVKLVACADLIPHCDARFNGESTTEIVLQYAAHACRMHRTEPIALESLLSVITAAA